MGRQGGEWGGRGWLLLPFKFVSILFNANDAAVGWASCEKKTTKTRELARGRDPLT